MKHYCTLTPDGWIIGVVTVDENDGDDYANDPEFTHLPDWAGWPVAPAPNLRLRMVDAALVWQDPNTLSDTKARKWVELKGIRDTLDTASILVDGIELDTKGESKMDFIGAILAMQITGQTERQWRCADNIMRTLTLTQIIQAGVGISNRRSALIGISDTLFQDIEAATTSAEVLAVHWPVQ